MWDQLSSSLAILKAGRDLDMGTIRHTAGRLGWYAEVLQSGRCRTKGWWGYTRFWKQLRPVNRAGLIKDTEWWLEKIRVWADGGLSGVEYPILTADETLRAPHTIYIVQSDASGGDGFGFVEGFLEDENPGYVSRQWGDGYSFFTSHNGELQAFLFWIRTTSIRSKLVLWVTDCLSAVWSVNKGGCHEDAGFETLSSVLEEADEKGLFLLALWCPREHNRFPDYLSHLATYLLRVETRGHVGDFLKPSAQGGDVSHGKEERQGGGACRSELYGVVREAPSGGLPPVVPFPVGVRVQSRAPQPRVDEKHFGRAQQPQGTRPSSGSRMDRAERQLKAVRVSAGVEISRLHGVQPKAPPSTGAAAVICEEVGSQRTSNVGASSHAAHRPQWFVAQRRAAVGSQGSARFVGTQPQRVHPLFRANKNL